MNSLKENIKHKYWEKKEAVAETKKMLFALIAVVLLTESVVFLSSCNIELKRISEVKKSFNIYKKCPSCAPLSLYSLLGRRDTPPGVVPGAKANLSVSEKLWTSPKRVSLRPSSQNFL